MDFAHSIKSLRSCTSITPVSGGYSTDKKYIVVKGDQKMLLRTFSTNDYAQKESEFSALKAMNSLGVRCSRAIEIGLVEDQSIGYALMSFIEGEDGTVALPKLSKEAQFKIGFEAGQELKKINSLGAPSEVSSWTIRKGAKHARYLASYLKGDIKIRHDSAIIEFIEKHSGMMEGRPNNFQHDDFHPVNLVIHDSRLAGVIDFGRHDWGDPIHEFIKLGHFASSVSVPYSVGQVMGYHDGKEPDEHFWKLYSLYSAMSFFSGIVWTQHVCPDEMPLTLKMIDRVIDEQDCFQRPIPRWFSKSV